MGHLGSGAGGSIPARAGSRRRPAARRTSRRVHPRASGEQDLIQPPMALIPGPSPRERGAGGHQLRFEVLDGSIPAQARNRSSGSGPASPATIPTHPRAQPRGTGRRAGWRPARHTDPGRTRTPAARPVPYESHTRHPITALSTPHHQGKQPERHPAPHTHHTAPRLRTPPAPGTTRTPTDTTRPAGSGRPGKASTNGQEGTRKDAATAQALARQARALSPTTRPGAESSRSCTPRQQEHQPTPHVPHAIYAYRIQNPGAMQKTHHPLPQHHPRAGSSASSRTSRQQSRVHPRERREQRVQGATAEALLGPSLHEREQLTASWTDTGTSGPSPHARRAGVVREEDPAGAGTIPTRTGNSPTAWPATSAAWGHPSGRGEQDPHHRLQGGRSGTIPAGVGSSDFHGT